MTTPAKVEPAELYGFTRDQINLLKNVIAKGASDDELTLLLYQSRRTGLDPLSRQIYLVPRWDSQLNRLVRTIGVSIDGLRLVAARSGKYAGQTAPQWCGSDGKWRDVWLDSEPPAAAKAGVLHKEFEIAIVAVARFESYVQTTKEGKPNRAWKEMPDIMIAKCAEALALRKAFPQDLSGLYTDDEHPGDEIKEVKEVPEVSYRQPESGPQPTRTEAIALCAKVIAAVKAGKDSEQKQLALDMAADELNRIRDNFPDVYDRMQLAVAKDAEETGL